MRLRYLPNVLTFLRLISIIPLAVFFWRGQYGLTFALLVFCGLTDFFDGLLARELHWKSKLGSWLDPTADKLLLTTCFVILLAKGFLPCWYFLMVLGRDIGLVLGIFLLKIQGSKVRIRPFFTGKVAATSQIFVLIFAALHPLFPKVKPILEVFLFLSAGLTLLSVGIYAKEFLKQQILLRKALK